jgi:hypothetical protein
MRLFREVLPAVVKAGGQRPVARPADLPLGHPGVSAMNLSKEDADLFFKLMWRLQFYVNRQRHILANVTSLEEYQALSMAANASVRDALWENPGLIDAYFAENPDSLPAEELAIILKWKRFIAGTFQIFRFLKKHAIFIGEKSQVYAVLGLYDSLEDMFWEHRPPIMVKAVLLPFKGKIIYDGMMNIYNIFFGGGIRSGLNEDYMAAKQNNRIITTLEPESGQLAQTPQKTEKDWRPEVDEIVVRTEKLKGGPAVQSSAFGLLRASATLAQATVHNPDDLDELWNLESRVRTALSRFQTVLSRAQG